MATEIPQGGIRPDTQRATDGEPVKKRLDDLVVGVSKRYGEDYHVLNIAQLEQAMTDGTLSQEEFNRSLGRSFTLAGRIRQLEANIAEGDPYGMHKRDLKMFRAMRDAREQYAPCDDNTTLEVFSNNREQLQQDFSTIFGEKRGKYKVRTNLQRSQDTYSVNEIIPSLFPVNENNDEVVFGDVVFDYPKLSHTMRIDPIEKADRPEEDGGAYRLPFTFFHHSKPYTGALARTMTCPADMLSLVRLAHAFKEKGHSVQLAISRDPIRSTDGKWIRYAAK